MTTAQLTGRINLDLYRDGAIPVSCPAGLRRPGARTAGKARAGRKLADIIPAVVERLERSDTLADRAVGYGVPALTLFYLTGHIIKAVF